MREDSSPLACGERGCIELRAPLSCATRVLCGKKGEMGEVFFDSVWYASRQGPRSIPSRIEYETYGEDPAVPPFRHWTIERSFCMNEPVTTIDSRFSDSDAVATGWDETRRVLETAELFWLVTVRA